MGLFIIALISIFLCFKWGDWKHWRLYYPTILFYIICDFNHVILTPNKDLWLIHGFWSDIWADYFVAFLIAPFVVVLFLSNYPEKRIKQVIYVLSYIAVFSTIEFIAQILNGIKYYNGWNLMWSMSLYVSAFILLRLHHRYPLCAWFIFALLNCLVIYYFKIPLASLQ